MVTPCLGSSESLPPPQLVRCATKPRACLPRRGPSWATYPPELFEGMEARPSVARALLDQSKALRGLGRASEAADAENQALQLGRQLGLKDAPFA